MPCTEAYREHIECTFSAFLQSCHTLCGNQPMVSSEHTHARGGEAVLNPLTASAAYRMIGGDKGGGHVNHDEHERCDSRSDEDPAV